MKLWPPLLGALTALAVANVVSAASANALHARASQSAYLTGEALLRAHQFKQAEAAFRQAIARKDHPALAYAGLGTASIDLGDYTGGFVAYRSAAALAPNSASMNYYAALAALYARQYPAAVQYATRSLALRPGYYPTYHLRFLAYGQLKSKKKQLADARTEAKLMPGTPDTWNDLGIALGNNADFKAAIDAFSHAIRLRPSYWAYYKNRGIIETYYKKPDAALRDFKTARALAPDAADKKLLSSTITRLQKHTHH